ncbi:MAG TPA: hypothetical protein VGJ05_10450 [Fimbriiglobus sp.]|jgi:hypothetical protein
MADGHVEAADSPPRRPPLWTNLFRCFTVALDPKKLAAAAAGILVMTFGWWVLSRCFDPGPAPDPKNYADAGEDGARKFVQDYAQWKVRDELAGRDGGKLRTMPWYEYRGRNPYLFATEISGSPSATWFDETWKYVKEQLPVLAEPLNKLILPVIKIVDPHATFATRVYLLLVIIWGVATWGFFGGVITRIAAVQLTGKDRTTLAQAVRFVYNRYWSYVLSPIVPIGVVAAIAIALMVFGFVALIPIAGDVLYGLGFPLLLLGGLIMAVLLVGLVGYPLMFPTLSVEGSDTFDALSRAYNYVFQAPWQYLWNCIVALAYGVVVTFFVVLMGSLTVYLAKWAIMQTPLTQTTKQEPSYLFVYTPETYGWKKLLLSGTPIEVVEQKQSQGNRTTVSYPYADPDRAKKYEDSYQVWNYLGAGLTAFWLVVVLLFMLGFGYSYFWSAATMIYLNMRKVVDETDLDEIYLEEDDPEAPIAPPPSAPVLPANPGTSLPMVPPAPPPASLPMTPPPPENPPGHPPTT